MAASLLLQVKVKPNGRVSQLMEQTDGSWLAQLKSPPVDGKANAELIELIARHFHCKKKDVQIKSGESGRMKQVTVQAH